ncbi:MAG: hypothetical protein RLZZ500_107 [Bacteroidota bacterium]|jgi:putative Ca2+/H+ antiporter (TMEM165/GDT1 family)
MKKIILFFFLFTCSIQYAQEISQIEFKKDSDYKLAEPKVVESATFLLEHPIDSDEMLRISHLQFLMRWMEGTPDYTFSLTETASKFSGENSSLLGIYLASMIQYLVKEHGDPTAIATVELNTVRIATNYVAKKENHVPLTATLKKLIEANEKGNLDAVIQKL